MKNRKLLLALVSGFLLVGAGCSAEVATPNPAVPSNPVVQEDSATDAPSAGEDKETLEPGITEETLADGDIGFAVNPPRSWGTFSVVLYKNATAKNPDVGEDWEYRGTFSGKPGVFYRATDPEHVVAREGYPGDVLGYKKDADGYSVNSGGKKWVRVPKTLVAEEVPLANGTALLIHGPKTADGPSPFPNGPGELVAYVNTPNGPLPGGVFIANADAGITADEMKAMLATVTIR